MARHSTNQELRSVAAGHHRVGDSIMTSIVSQDRVKRKIIKPDTGYDLSILADLAEVGESTPPLKIYKPDPVTGALVLTETISAQVFRRRVFESVDGKRFRSRMREMQKKRQRAGQRAKTKARVAKRQMEKAGAAR